MFNRSNRMEDLDEREEDMFGDEEEDDFSVNKLGQQTSSKTNRNKISATVYKPTFWVRYVAKP